MSDKGDEKVKLPLRYTLYFYIMFACVLLEFGVMMIVFTPFTLKKEYDQSEVVFEGIGNTTMGIIEDVYLKRLNPNYTRGINKIIFIDFDQWKEGENLLG